MDNMTTYARISFGNMGFSGTDCAKNLVNWEGTETNLYLQCQGTTTITDVHGGVGMDHDNIITMCYINKEEHDKEHEDEEDLRNFKVEEFKQSILSQCKGKQTCNAIVPNWMTGIGPKFQETYMYLFAQVSCTQTEEMLMEKKVWGLAAACLGLAICMIFSISMTYLVRMDAINDKLYDMKLVTVSDYAIMGQIPRAMYEKFKLSLQITGQTGQPIVLFRDALTDSLELQLQ